MVGLNPYIIIHSPSGVEDTFDLQDISSSIGRLPENDIALTEDPNSEISRIKHCVITREEGFWMLCDYSTNGTEVELDGIREDIHKTKTTDKVPIKSGTVIHIGSYRLSFHDPNATRKNPRRANSYSNPPVAVPSQDQVPSQGQFIYVVDTPALYYQSPDLNQSRQYIHCRPQVHEMLEYMARKKRDEGDSQATYEELIKALSPGEEQYTKETIRGLARAIRRTFTRHSPESDERTLLVTVSGEGYALNIECE